MLRSRVILGFRATPECWTRILSAARRCRCVGGRSTFLGTGFNDILPDFPISWWDGALSGIEVSKHRNISTRAHRTMPDFKVQQKAKCFAGAEIEKILFAILHRTGYSVDDKKSILFRYLGNGVSRMTSSRNGLDWQRDNLFDKQANCRVVQSALNASLFLRLSIYIFRPPCDWQAHLHERHHCGRAHSDVPSSLLCFFFGREKKH